MRVKNASGASGVWVGQTIANGAYYTIEAIEITAWKSDGAVLLSLSNGNLIGNDGTTDLSSTAAIQLLLGSAIEITKQAEPQPFAVPTYRTKLNATPSLVTVAPNTDEDIDFLLTEERYVTGGSITIQNAVLGDYIEATVSDIDGIIPSPYRAALCEAWPVVGKYIEKQWIEVAGEHTTMKINTYPLNAKITAGLYLCIKYFAVNSGSDRKVAVNYHLTKKL